LTTVLHPGPADLEWREEYRKVRGLRTFSRACGTGVEGAILLVHGVGVSSAYWMPAQRELARLGFRVHAVDLPGFGRSQDPRWPPRLELLTEHLLAWMDGARLERCHLVGQSMGCELAVLAAAARPEQFRRVVLAAPAGLPHLRSVFVQLLRAAVDAPHETLPLFRVILPDYFRCGPLRFFRMLWEQKRRVTEERLGDVRQPVLILRGEKDTVATPGRVAALAGLLREADTATIHGAHAAHFTHPREFAETVAGFLIARVSPAVR
jgi:pimeloyl-ACP methyl ester carboxylesterase